MPDHYKGPLLTEGKYATWSIKAKAMLTKQELWAFVGPFNAERMPRGPKASQTLQLKNELACASIIDTLDESQLAFVDGIIDPRVMWDELAEIHRAGMTNSVLSLRRRFLHMSMDPGESVMSWVGRVRSAALDLSVTKAPATEFDQILVLVNGLRSEFEPLLTIIDDIPIDSLDFSAVQKKLFGFETQLRTAINKADPSPSSESLDFSANIARGASVRPRSRVVCHGCGGKGHFISECPSIQPKGAEEPGAHAAVAEPHNIHANVAIEEDSETFRLY